MLHIRDTDVFLVATFSRRAQSTFFLFAAFFRREKSLPVLSRPTFKVQNIDIYFFSSSLLFQMRRIDCAHEAGISATLAGELSGMVSPRAAWIASPTDEQGEDVDIAENVAAAPARGGLVAILEDRFPREPSGMCVYFFVRLCLSLSSSLSLYLSVPP